MGKLIEYRSKVGVSQDAPGFTPPKATPSVVDTSGISSGLEGAASALLEAERAMLDVRDFKESTEASNVNGDSRNEINYLFEQDLDGNPTEYEAMYDKATTEASKLITSKSGREKFLLNAQSQNIAAKWGIKHLHLDRQHKAAQAGIGYERERIVTDYPSMNDASQVAALSEYSKSLRDAYGKGIILKEFVEFELGKDGVPGKFEKDLVKAQANYLITTNPEEFLDIINNDKEGMFDLLDDAEKIELASSAKDILKKMVEGKTIDSLRGKLTAQGDFENKLGDMSLGEALKELDNGLEFGIFSDNWAEAKKKAILSVAGVTRDKMDKFEHSMIMKIADITAGYKSKEKKNRKAEDAKSYLNGVNNISIEINNGLKDGLMTKSTANTLFKQIYDMTTAQATEKVIANKWFTYDVSDADKYFKKVLNPEDRYSAVRDFYYKETENPDAKKEERTKWATDIADKIKTGRRNDVLEQGDITAVKGKTPTFGSEADVEAANLPDGTEVIVDGIHYKWVNKKE